MIKDRLTSEETNITRSAMKKKRNHHKKPYRG